VTAAASLNDSGHVLTVVDRTLTRRFAFDPHILQHLNTMSVSGSISRRRVGSVSQRGLEAGLPPLDIQSIQMPSNP
jgi:hypothetical protein